MHYLHNSSQQKVAETATNSGGFYGSFPKHTILDLKDRFLDYAQFESCFSPQTIQKYDDYLRNFTKSVGNMPVNELRLEHFIELRKKMMLRNVGNARMVSIVFTLKSFLRYCKEVQEIECLDASKIKSPM